MATFALVQRDGDAAFRFMAVDGARVEHMAIGGGGAAELQDEGAGECARCNRWSSACAAFMACGAAVLDEQWSEPHQLRCMACGLPLGIEEHMAEIEVSLGCGVYLGPGWRACGIWHGDAAGQFCSLGGKASGGQRCTSHSDSQAMMVGIPHGPS
jgi:hypothetical protein